MRRILRWLAVTATFALPLAGTDTALGSTGASMPTATNGNQIQLIAAGLMEPTSFAFGDGAVFEGDGGNGNKTPNGGLYVLSGGKATKVPTKLVFVGGLEFHDGALYVSGAELGPKGPEFQILDFAGWNGKTFTSQKPIYTAPKGFDGFNGLGFGADGRLYVGVDVGLTDNNDHGAAGTSPYLYDILSMSSKGGGVSVFATGIRQPWQLAFPSGSSSPFVSDFGQDHGGNNPPDFLLRVTAGQNYGFPHCDWTKASHCTGDAKPLKPFAPHTDVGGVAIAGAHIYLSEFGFAAPQHSAAIVSLPLTGTGSPAAVVHDFPNGDAVIGLGAHADDLYFGVVTKKQGGLVYRLHVNGA